MGSEQRPNDDSELGDVPETPQTIEGVCEILELAEMHRERHEALIADAGEALTDYMNENGVFELKGFDSIESEVYPAGKQDITERGFGVGPKWRGIVTELNRHIPEPYTIWRHRGGLLITRGDKEKLPGASESDDSETERDREHKKRIKQLIRDLQEEYDDRIGAPESKVLNHAEELGISQKRLAHEIQKLRDKGEIYSPDQDHLRLV